MRMLIAPLQERSERGRRKMIRRNCLIGGLFALFLARASMKAWAKREGFS